MGMLSQAWIDAEVSGWSVKVVREYGGRIGTYGPYRWRWLARMVAWLLRDVSH